VIGRTPALYRMSRSAWAAVLPLLRRGLRLALAAGLIGAAGGGLTAGMIAASRPDRYAAVAVFDLVDYVHSGTTVSLSRAILAEQTVRVLRDGSAGTIASRATSAAIDGEWVPGPGFGQLSFRVESADPRAATAAATAVHDAAGFLGFGLMPQNLDQEDKPALDLLPVQKAAPVRKSLAKTAAAGVVFGGFAGFALALLVAVPVRPARAAVPEAR
jgi:pimeloyl-ACP methyl ester carboxylesterase